MSINLATMASFTWDFDRNFLLQVPPLDSDDYENQADYEEALKNIKYYVWSDPDYGGDNTIQPYMENPYNFTSEGFCGRDKGVHNILSYCGPNVKFVNC
jgi:hypothetical protein